MTLTSPGLTLGRRLGAGGEAEVFDVPGRPGLVYKRYLHPDGARRQKLEAMIGDPPAEVAGHRGHLSMAWPNEIVADSRGVVTGFLMPEVDLSSSVPVFQVYNPQSRRAVAPAFTWRYLLRTARNLAAIVDALHRSGYVIGDVNESNFLVTKTALVVLVDCDSLQVTDPQSGVVYPCPVAKPEFTAPEFQSGVPSQRQRTTESDDFSLALLIHLLLFEGVHPFAGIWRGRGDPPDLGGRIARGCPARRRLSRVVPPPAALPRRTLPPELRRLMSSALGSGLRHPRSRPTARAWVEALDRAEAGLRPCARSPHHLFAGHLRACPWCARIDMGLPDPFPGPSGQSTLTRRPPPWWRSAVRRARAGLRQGLRRTGRGLLRLGSRLRPVQDPAEVAEATASRSRRWWPPLRSITRSGVMSRRAPLAVLALAVSSMLPGLTVLAAMAAAVRWSATSVARRIGAAAATCVVVATAAWSVGADGIPSRLLTVAGGGRAVPALAVALAVLVEGGRLRPLPVPGAARAARWLRSPAVSPYVAYTLWVAAAAVSVVAMASVGRWWPLPVR